MSELHYNSYDPRSEMPVELLRTPDGGAVTATLDVEPDERVALWEMVQQGFIDLNRKSYEKQDMTREEFEADMDSRHVIKYISRDKDGVSTGILTVHMGFEDIVWTDIRRLQAVQDDVDPSAVPYYVGTIVVPPGDRGSHSAEDLIQGAFHHFRQVNTANNMQSLLFMDCAEANHPWLAEYVEKVGSSSEQYPDLKAHVRELYSLSWVTTPDGPKQVQDISGIDPSDVLDTQHYYVVGIETTTTE